jgi:hypothetical protein
MMPTAFAKIRYLVATSGRTLRTIGALLLLLGIVGVVLTMLFPPTMAVAEVTDRSVVETETTTTATVEGDHAMYTAGENLTDEPVYVRSVAPTVTVTATTRAPPDGVAVDQRVAIVYEASSTEDGVFRQQKHAVTATSGTIERDGETVESVVSLRVADIGATLEAMREEIGDAGRVNAYLHIETVYAGDGYEGTLEDQAELAVSDDSYRIPALELREEHRTTMSKVEPVATEVFQPTIPTLGPVVVPHLTPVFGFLAVFGGVLLGTVRYGRTEFDADRERVVIHRLRYGEWISGGELPPALAEHPLVVPVESLEALVDVAIDSDTRVIHDPNQDCYAVMTGVAIFVFYPDTVGGFVFNNGNRPES